MLGNDSWTGMQARQGPALLMSRGAAHSKGSVVMGTYLPVPTATGRKSLLFGMEA